MIASFSSLSGAELTSLAPELTVFLFALGGLEQHGVHLPMGTKIFQAEEFTHTLAKQIQIRMPNWNFVVMPVLPFTVDTITSKIALNVRAHVVRDVLVDQCRSLKRLGFSNFAAISAHATPRQLSAIEDAASLVQKKKWIFVGERSVFVSVSSAAVKSSDVWRSPMIALPSEHGGAKDTGWILKLNGKLISQDPQTLPDIAKPEPSMANTLSYFRHETDGYWGKPKEASAESAQFHLNHDVEEVLSNLQIVLEQNQGQSFFQSGYRYFPINGSFFKAYFLGLIFFILMLAVMMLNLKEAFSG